MDTTLSAPEQLADRVRRLDALVVRLDRIRAALPQPDDPLWRGPAARQFATAITRLAADLSAARHAIGDAAMDSRRAVMVMTHG